MKCALPYFNLENSFELKWLLEVNYVYMYVCLLTLSQDKMIQINNIEHYRI